MQLNVSVIVCTYNPDERLLTPALAALARLATCDPAARELILVDNRSDPPLAEREYVRKFLAVTRGARLVREERPGLVYARLTALAVSTGDWLCFIDDDGVVDPGYVRELARLIAAFPAVGVWGAGTIDVEYVDPTPAGFAKHYTHYFLERSAAQLMYACLREPWASCYPFGLGMTIRRDLLERYRDAFDKGAYTQTGRRGTSLASSEDMQICYAAMSAGSAVGIAPELACRHLIPSRRANRRYVVKLTFQSGVTNLLAAYEAFPEHRPASVASATRVTVACARAAAHWLPRCRRVDLRIAQARILAGAVASFQWMGRPVPRWLRTLVYVLLPGCSVSA